MFLKLAMIVYYLGVYVMSLEIRGSENVDEINKFFVLTTVNLLLFPVLSGLYSWALLMGKLS